MTIYNGILGVCYNFCSLNSFFAELSYQRTSLSLSEKKMWAIEK